MSTILVTGATGGLGGAVANFLIKAEKEERLAVLVRDPEADKARELASLGVELRVADYNDPDKLAAAFEGIEYLYFVSGSDIANRHTQHRNVVDASIKSGVKHLIYTSVSVVGLTENSPLFGAMKVHFDTEDWIRNSGLTYTILRHNLYAESVPMFIGGKAQLFASKTVFLPAGEGRASFVARIDLAEAGAKILSSADDHANKEYSFDGTEAISYGDVAAILTDVTGQRINYVSPSVEAFEATMKTHQVPADIIGLMTAFSLAQEQGVFAASNPDLEQILGRKPMSMKAFLALVY